MRVPKREMISFPQKARKTVKYASRGASFGMMAVCIGIMAAVVARGIQLDRQEEEIRKIDAQYEKEKEAF